MPANHDPTRLALDAERHARDNDRRGTYSHTVTAGTRHCNLDCEVCREWEQRKAEMGLDSGVEGGGV